jgi:aspartyl-tRNA(Asn)/glutamyl-tRNA(Gln) amidotransferase subunit C
MAIRPDEVRRIAELARLEIPEERIERMTAELSAVLEFAGTLQRLDLEGCAPGTFAPAGAPLREDALDGRRLGAERALEAAPEGEDGFFLVPPVVENLNP